MDGPFDLQLVVGEAEGPAAAEERDVGGGELGLLLDLAAGGGLGAGVGGLDGAGADGPFASGEC